MEPRTLPKMLRQLYDIRKQISGSMYYNNDGEVARTRPQRTEKEATGRNNHDRITNGEEERRRSAERLAGMRRSQIQPRRV